MLVSIPVLCILGGLLASADAVFNDMFRRFFDEFISLGSIIGILFMAAFGFMSSYCGMRYAGSDAGRITVKDRRKAGAVIPATVTGAVCVLYLAFSVVQILYLFIGGFALPEGMSYAEYAREGFFQLMLVCLLNFVAVLVIKKYIIRSRLLDAELLLICFCTYIMIASSAIRMLMYISAYRLTYDRFAVLTVLLLLAVLMAGVAIYVINESFPLKKYIIGVTCVIYTVFAFSRPDSITASYNLQINNQRLAAHDLSYISILSADAAPAIAEYTRAKGLTEEKPVFSEWYVSYCRNNGLDGKPDGIRKYNISRFRAEKELIVPGPEYMSTETVRVEFALD